MSAHFSFTNSLYDNCNLDKKQQESTGPFNWITTPVYEHKDSCYVNVSPFMHKQFNNIPANSIEIENEITNRSRHLSRCPETRYDPTKLDNCKDCEQCNQGLPCSCAHCRQTKFENKIKDCEDVFLVLPSYAEPFSQQIRQIIFAEKQKLCMFLGFHLSALGGLYCDHGNKLMWGNYSSCTGTFFCIQLHSRNVNHIYWV